ncbi:MAG: ARPP-1 family domain-containing protein [Chloroflexota bacterium]
MGVRMDDIEARTALDTALGTVRQEVVLSRDGLVLVALAWDGVDAPGYRTASAAAREGTLELREQAAATVPAIEAVTTTTPVVIFAGDTVEGGRQNRIINVTVWLSAGKVTQIPVSCLEAGRWNAGVRFRSSIKADVRMRAKMSRQVVDSAGRAHAAAGAWPAAPPDISAFASDQGEVWSEIAQREQRARYRSHTSALHEVYAAEAQDLAGFARSFPCPVGAHGVAVGIGGRIVSAELFDAEATLAEQWPRLVEAAVAAWADHGRAVTAGYEPAPLHRYPDPGAVDRMLARARSASGTAIARPSVGAGTDLRLSAVRLSGGALVVDGCPVHVELFRADD